MCTYLYTRKGLCMIYELLQLFTPLTTDTHVPIISVTCDGVGSTIAYIKFMTCLINIVEFINIKNVYKKNVVYLFHNFYNSFI